MKDNNLDGALNGAITTPYWYNGPGTILSAPWSPVSKAVTVYDAKTGYRVAASLSGTLPRDQMDLLIINQVKTLGKGTTGLTAGTVGPGGGLYTSQAQTGLGSNGYGTIQSGVKDADADNDGMPDYWETAMGFNSNVNDAMKIGSDGYAAIEQYINWLADFHARTNSNAAVDIDLTKYTYGFSDVNPVFAVSNAVNGTVALSTDRHTAQFTPSSGFHGLASFSFTVTGSDNTAFSGKVAIAVVPSTVVLEKNRLNTLAQQKQAILCSGPVTNTLKLVYPDAAAFTIADVSGRLLIKRDNLSMAPVRQIDVSGLRNGVYVLQVYSSEGRSLFRFLKRN
jgi:hypothetical protein